LVHSTEQAKKFVKANGEIWFGEAFDIPTAVKELGADNLNEKLKQQIDEAAAAYDKLATTASEKGAVLRGVAAQVERRMKAQAEYEQRQAAEEEEGEIVCATAG